MSKSIKKATKKSATKSATKATVKSQAAEEPDWIIPDLRPLAVPIGELILDPKNAREHTSRDLAALQQSLKRYKQRTPIVVNRATRVIAKGNGTYLAALQLQWTHLAVVWVDDDDATQHGYAIADNRTAELSSWNQEMLDLLISEYSEQWGTLSDDLYLFDLLEQADASSEDSEPKEAKGDVVPDSWQVVVYCDDESDQERIHKEMERRGYKCRLLTF